MKTLTVTILTLIMSIQTEILVQFNPNSSLENWYIVDDVVMGGRSSGSFYINPEGHGVFEGRVSLENNGGFSSLKYRMSKTEINKHASILLRVKGDGKTYQLRIKDKTSNYYAYTASFATTESWEII